MRPYSDFSPWGKLVKATVPLRKAGTFQGLQMLLIRTVRYAETSVSSGPTAFHFRRLTPNYEQYWVPDADAVNSMDPYEVVLWFQSRGD